MLAGTTARHDSRPFFFAQPAAAAERLGHRQENKATPPFLKQYYCYSTNQHECQKGLLAIFYVFSIKFGFEARGNIYSFRLASAFCKPGGATYHDAYSFNDNFPHFQSSLAILCLSSSGSKHAGLRPNTNVGNYHRMVLFRPPVQHLLPRSITAPSRWLAYTSGKRKNMLHLFHLGNCLTECLLAEERDCGSK